MSGCTGAGPSPGERGGNQSALEQGAPSLHRGPAGEDSAAAGHRPPLHIRPHHLCPAGQTASINVCLSVSVRPSVISVLQTNQLPAACLPVCLPVCLSVCHSVCLPLRLSVGLSFYRSVLKLRQCSHYGQDTRHCLS